MIVFSSIAQRNGGVKNILDDLFINIYVSLDIVRLKNIRSIE